MNRSKRLFIAGGAAAVAAAALVTFSSEKEAHALSMNAGVRSWPGGNIPVCIDAGLASQPGFDRFDVVLRNNVDNTWGKVANVRFTGWGTCPSPWPAGTVVLYYEPGGFNAQEGYNPSGATTLKIDFNYNGPWGNNSYPARWSYLVVHEFGHLLGFEHEMDRPDNPYWSDKTQGCSQVDGPPAPYSGMTLLTPYDPSSIMNYCESMAPVQVPGLEADLSWTQPLSAWDVAGVQALYGRKPAGSIAGLGGRCVNIANDSHSWGASLVAYDCYGGENDTWSRKEDGVDLTFAANLGGTLEAIDVPNATIGTGFTRLWDYPVNDSVAQQFAFTGVQWKAFGDMCVVPNSSSTGEYLRVQPCTGTNPLERWDFEPNGRFRLSGTGQCANVPWASATSGNPIVLYPCGSPSPYPNEIFQTTDRGELVYGGMCMNVWRGNMQPGSPIALYACGGATPYTNEQFHASGPIHGEGGQCLTNMGFPDGVARNGNPIGLSPCDGTISQNWDYYFLNRR